LFLYFTAFPWWGWGGGGRPPNEINFNMAVILTELNTQKIP
jgi:hypothetical protein